jgi:microcystin degradation protein MlrC
MIMDESNFCFTSLGRCATGLEAVDAPNRVLLAGIYHQTNTFVSGRTTLEDFEIKRGDEILAEADGASPFAGALEIAQEKDWEVLPVVYLRAMPGARVADAAVELFWAEFRAVADAAASDGLDGVFLVMHGAMVSESLTDVEGEMLRRIRGVEPLSYAPICGVLDVHANFTETMARQSDGLIACREDPPADAREAAQDAALLLEGLMQTEARPATVWEHPPIMWPPSGTATDSEPMLSLEERAREMETEDAGMLAVNVFAGFPFADVPEAGVSFSAISLGDLELARSVLREQNVLASSLREAGTRPGMPLEEALRCLERRREGPVLLVESSDDIWAGAPGDGTCVLRALIEHGVHNAGAIINDPEAVVSLRNARPGERREVLIGGKSDTTPSEPLPLEVELVSRSDGRFVPEGNAYHPAFVLGDAVDMGPCAVVRHESTIVLVTSRRTPPFDLAQWRSQGVDPEGLFAIVVKSATGHRPAYDPIATETYTLDLPGPCTQDLRRLTFERVSRPVYPLDSL